MGVKLQKVPPIGFVRVKNADASYAVDGEGIGAYARMHTPSSKVWEAANADRRRKQLKRVRESGGKIEAAADEPNEDVIDYLVAITEEFINLDAPDGVTGKAAVRAIYTDPEQGFIRDQMDADSKDWGAFLAALPPSSNAGSGNMPG